MNSLGIVLCQLLEMSCREELKVLAVKNRLTLYCVPGHSGKVKADEYARYGSLTPYIGPKPAVRVPNSNQITVNKKHSGKIYPETNMEKPS